MSQELFTRRHAEDWSTLDKALDSRALAKQDPDLPARYRRLCQHLALARHRRYGARLIDRLNRLAARGHAQLYAHKVVSARELVERLVEDFPRVVRREWRVVLAAHAVFYVPFLGMMAAVLLDPALVFAALDPEMTSQLEAMYDPTAEHHLKERASDSDLLMFGFYIKNNIGIALRTFASGALVGLGALFFLVYNGLVLGGAAGHLTVVGFGETFWSFVCTHGAFELTAIVLSGAAGMKLGFTLLAPGRRTRSRALAEEARRIMPMVWGFALMLVAAAFVEAFWSSSKLLPTTVKYAAAGICWTGVYSYLLLAGRSRAA
jgi:uncharacterized membrane protein SpoIIM required for sporulation